MASRLKDHLLAVLYQLPTPRLFDRFGRPICQHKSIQYEQGRNSDRVRHRDISRKNRVSVGARTLTS
jgi:hypothetical protein